VWRQNAASTVFHIVGHSQSASPSAISPTAPPGRRTMRAVNAASANDTTAAMKKIAVSFEFGANAAISVIMDDLYPRETGAQS
jgi:hypothetical protein